ncbi:winged helix-turn-helix domain-containing protein [Shewanella sp.]|uniref:winged helix-turn-helix domain-containing protein n=1 Tax=Shewanella sp. TaxID=50422 RepID=UPI00258B181B|nr:winged helix-turn-helix domain-containing protein [Shewanella sp.]MCJ8304654.1 winged helix-turn-helix domain-containing protein [Shewanella sp.]
MKEKAVAEIYGVGGRYVFNAKTDQLTDVSNDKIIELGLNESRLFSLLISHRGDVISREQILEEVWLKRGLVVDETSVNQTVSLLRKVLDDNVREQAYIKTVTKMGYMLTPGIEITEISEDAKADSSERFYRKSAVIKTIGAIFSGVLLALSLSSFLNEHAPEMAVQPYTDIKLDNVDLITYKDANVSKELSPLIEKCLHYVLDKYPKKINKVLVSARDKRSISLLFFDHNLTSFSFKIYLSSTKTLEDNKCRTF